MKNQLTLAIESSCDDTSIAIIQNDWTNFVVKKIVAYSQISDHQKYGGVVPELAYRIHEEKIIKLIDEIWRSQINEVDTISVTAEPWLMGSLMIGLTSAYAIGKFLNKPVIEVNHIYGHIFSILLERDITKIKLPMAVLTVSGGHNEIYIINHQNKAKSDNISDIYIDNVDSLTDWNNTKISDLQIQKIGHTLDDAAGESFDKVARMLGGSYPGGPWIYNQSLNGKHNTDYIFPRIRLDANRKYDFSFSGMKSCANQIITKFEKSGISPSEQDVCDICREFQEAVNDTLIYKWQMAVQDFDCKTIAIVGWVSANDRLFEKFLQKFGIYYWDNLTNIVEWNTNDIYICRPVRKLYSTDNAAMIWVVWLMS